MNRELRKSIITKWVALSFVMMIICGNVWFVYLVTQNPIPAWLFEVFRYTGYSIGLSGILFILVSIYFSFFTSGSGQGIDGIESEDDEP